MYCLSIIASSDDGNDNDEWQNVYHYFYLFIRHQILQFFNKFFVNLRNESIDGLGRPFFPIGKDFNISPFVIIQV